VQYAIKADQAATQNTSYSNNAASTAFHWGPHTWQQIEWRRQLVVVAGLFRQVGFQPRSLRAVGLTGADVLLASGNGQLLLRCVATRAGVSLSDMQAFARAIQARGLAHATYATGGRFSDRARAYARERHIHTLDGEQLLALIATRTPDQQDNLLQAAYAGAYWRPSCIRCGVKLTPKLRATDHRPQWACRNAPRCSVTLPMDMAQLSAPDRPARRTAPAEQAGFVDPAYAATEPMPLRAWSVASQL
jgi:restriction system protein